MFVVIIIYCWLILQLYLQIFMLIKDRCEIQQIIPSQNPIMPVALWKRGPWALIDVLLSDSSHMWQIFICRLWQVKVLHKRIILIWDTCTEWWQNDLEHYSRRSKVLHMCLSLLYYVSRAHEIEICPSVSQLYLNLMNGFLHCLVVASPPPCVRIFFLNFWRISLRGVFTNIFCFR